VIAFPSPHRPTTSLEGELVLCRSREPRREAHPGGIGGLRRRRGDALVERDGEFAHGHGVFGVAPHSYCSKAATRSLPACYEFRTTWSAASKPAACVNDATVREPAAAAPRAPFASPLRLQPLRGARDCPTSLWCGAPRTRTRSSTRVSLSRKRFDAFEHFVHERRSRADERFASAVP
jgi:hypothetical protein